MPIFEYQCDKCKSTFEILVRNSEETPACPECGSKKLSKQMSQFISSSGTKDCPSGGPCGHESGPGQHCCGDSCGCGH